MKIILLCLILLSATVAMAQQRLGPNNPDFDLCRRQLSSVRDQMDSNEREMYKQVEKLQADAEAQKATLIEWLQTAQAKQ